jgi:cohesin loading factor subunit SCC2
MVQYRSVYENNTEDPRLPSVTPKFRRALYTVGLLLKHFDFSQKELYEGLPVSDFIGCSREY